MSRRDTAVFEAMCDRALDDDRERDAEHWDEYDRLMEAADNYRKERHFND